MTSIPKPDNVLTTRSRNIGPLIRPSRPTTTFAVLFFDERIAPNAAVNFTISKGVRFSPVFPPTVPLMPEMLLINATINKLICTDSPALRQTGLMVLS
jgi:hypothetical protein